MSNFALFTMKFGMLVLYICKTKLRFSGILLIVIASIMTYIQPIPDLIIDSKNKVFLINNKDTIILSNKSISKYTRETWINYIGIKDFTCLDFTVSAKSIDCKSDFECRYSKGNYDLIFSKQYIDVVDNNTKKLLQHLQMASQLIDIYMVYLDKPRIVSLQKLRRDSLWTATHLVQPKLL